MNKLQIFNNEEFGQVRTITKDNEVWFVGKDVAECLGYARPVKAILDHVDEDDKDGIPIQDSIGRTQNTPMINESGLYSLILSSKLPNAKKFKRWVTSEVLPSIRKTGSYSNKPTPMTIEDILITQLQEMKALKSTVTEMKQDITTTKDTINNIATTITASADNFRADCSRMLWECAKAVNSSNPQSCIQQIVNTAYTELEDRAHVNLKTRLNNLKARMNNNGATKTAMSKTNKLDVIMQDPKLTQIYLQVCKELKIKYTTTTLMPVVTVDIAM